MPLRMLKPEEKARNLGCMLWIEDLDRAGLSYGDVLAFLEGLHMPCVCSPVHDRDTYTADDVKGWCQRHIDPDTGEVRTEDLERQPQVGAPKKPHIHIYFAFKGVRQPKELSKYFDTLSPGIVAPNRFVLVPDFPGIVRYCAHMDSPEKAQYDPLSIHGFCNVNMSSIWGAESIDPMRTMIEVERAIVDYGIDDYWQLVRWVNANGDIEMIKCVKGRTAHWAAIFHAKRQERFDRKRRGKGQGMPSAVNIVEHNLTS